jgi:hypothetical protein
VSASDPQVRIATLERELHWAQLKIQVLEERLRKQRIQMLGPQSETLSNLQLELLADEEPGVTAEEVEAEARREALAKMPARERKPHPGRERLPENLPRIEKVIPCQDQRCRACGKETAVIGYDESEQLDVEPARYLVRVTRREKRACRSCEQGTVTMAPPGTAHHRKGSGERCGGDRHCCFQILRSHAAVSTGCDPGARSGPGDRAGNAGWLGNACGRAAATGGRCDAQGSAERLVSAS